MEGIDNAKEVISQFESGLITLNEAERRVAAFVPAKITIVEIIKDNIIQMKIIVYGFNDFEAINHVRLVNQKEIEEGEPMIKIKPPYSFSAYPLEFTMGIHII